MTDNDPPTTTDESSSDPPPTGGADPGRTASDGGADATSAPETGERLSLVDGFPDDLRQKLALGAVAILSLLAAWAVVRVYTSTNRAIALWISPDFVPIFAAAFNVVVALVAVAGIVYLVGRAE